MSIVRDEAVAAALAEIRAEYALELPAQVAALVAAVERARAGEPDVPGAARAQSLAHRLAGTAGSYGFDEISEAASRIDVALRALAGGAASPAEAWVEIEAALTGVTAALAALARVDEPQGS